MLNRISFLAIFLLAIVSLLEAQLAGFRTNYTYVGNKQSKLLHLTYYHHLPDDFLRENFLSLDDALEANYTKCPICFPDHPMVPGYDFERQLGISAAAILNFYYPVQAPDEVIQRVREAGTRILLNWPLPLKGYTYSFSAIESDMFKAFSCPTGFIYLTTGLLSILESDEELEMVLAHEISHIENRHAFQQSQAQFSSPRMTRDPVAVSRELDELARSLILVGYDEDAEEEADFYAQAYGISRYKEDRGTLILLLNKLRDISWQETRTGGGLFSGKSDLEKRIREIQETRIHMFPKNQTFLCRDASGVTIARAQLIMEKLDRDELTVFTAFWSKETIPLGVAGSGFLRIKTSETEQILPQKEVTFLRKHPDDERGFHTYVMTFAKKGSEDILPLDIRDVWAITFEKHQGLRNTRELLTFTR
ncbi:MAG: M48 family metalloprotease [Candidatus Glassbacteria bacterium]